MSHPSILCPVDFSWASRGALRYAIAIADHFGGRLTLLAVNDPILTEAAELRMGAASLASKGDRDLRRFLATAAPERTAPVDAIFHVATGKPASEILKRAHDDQTDLIVMSSRGNSGVRKLFFGATTERVLRETAHPVLVTPAHDQGPSDLESLRRRLHHILVPLDFLGAQSRHLDLGRAVANALDSSLLLTHVVEPVWFATAVQPRSADTDNERRNRAEDLLTNAAGPEHTRKKVELLTAFGDPAEEIAKIANDRQVGLIVMSLHSSPRTGPRMGSVTYRVLCLAPTLVLALPPPNVEAGDASGFATMSVESHFQ